MFFGAMQLNIFVDVGGSTRPANLLHRSSLRNLAFVGQAFGNASFLDIGAKFVASAIDFDEYVSEFKNVF